MRHADVCIAGAGIIGLSLALELQSRGASVTVITSDQPLAAASAVAAGMLAAGDPENPPELHDIARLSLHLYPAYLRHIESLSGTHVPFQTGTTLQSVHAPEATLSAEHLERLVPGIKAGGLHFKLLNEHSLDPRQLAPALQEAVAQSSIELHCNTPVQSVRSDAGGIEATTSEGNFHARQFVDCTGAWSLSSTHLPQLHVIPRKGQMLAVALPPSVLIETVVRTPELYIVPRTTGAQAGRAVIGATVEDVGFDTTVHPEAIQQLHLAATRLLPFLAGSSLVDSWAGLRPATEDSLPILGSIPGRPRHFIATGHFRNGILLAPRHRPPHGATPQQRRSLRGSDSFLTRAQPAVMPPEDSARANYLWVYRVALLYGRFLSKKTTPQEIFPAQLQVICSSTAQPRRYSRKPCDNRFSATL